jgi:transketolase
MFQSGKTLTDVNVPSLQARARAVRARVLRMAHAGRTPHVASALSCVDLLVALYFSVLRIDPANPDDPGRDRLLLSKGHGCMAQYGALTERGFFPEVVLQEYARDGGRLAEHPGPHCVPGIEAATGSLGHGLSIGAGLALAAKVRGANYRVFVVLSDGECYEGSVWEAALFAPALNLAGLTAIVDYNGWSAMAPTYPVMEPLAEKWRAFGWSVQEIDGHDVENLASVLAAVPFEPGRPSAIIARTVKGKGVSFMENDLEWHYRPPNDQDLERALLEISG